MRPSSPSSPSSPHWNVQEALKVMEAQVEPTIWEQGQELHHRGAVEDFQLSADGAIQVRVLDPRDLRKFVVAVERDRDGRVKARCPCPYRFNGHCRHQVVALLYLSAISEGKAEGKESTPAVTPVEGNPGAPAAPAGPVLYRLGGPPSRVTTRPDGSLLRVVLHSLGSRKALHRIGLQLFTGTGWTELRTGDLGRWITRGEAGIHPRDEAIASLLLDEGTVRSEVDSEKLSALLQVLGESGALSTRTGEPLSVSRWPFRLAARLVRGTGAGLAVEISCVSLSGESRPFAEVGLIPAAAPWIQLETGAFHPLVAGAPGPSLAELQEEDLSDVSGAELDRLLSRGVPELERLCPAAFEIEPGLIEEVEGVDGARVRLEGQPRRLSGSLELSYGGEWTPAPATPEPWTVHRGGEVRRYPPAGQSLARAERELLLRGFRREKDRWVIEGPGALRGALRPLPRPFVAIVLPEKLEPLNLLERSPLLRIDVDAGAGAWTPSGCSPAALEGARGGAGAGSAFHRPRSGISWLEASCRLLDGEREVPIDLDALRIAAAEDPAGLLQLEDGTVLGLAHPAVRSLLDLSTRAVDPHAPAGRLRLPVTSIGEVLEEAPGREVSFRGGALALLEGLSGRGADPEPLRPDLDPVLRPYQRDAVRWLGHLGGFGLAGILADEMGLGKTVMTLAHFFGRRRDPAGGESTGARAETPAAPVLVVCPSSLIWNWVEECRRFFPRVKAVGLYGLSPPEREERIREGADLLITSYALLRRDREALEARELRAVVLDEGQHVKNPESQTAQAAFALKAPQRWILTGTPIENHLGELWSLFHFLLPGFLGKRNEFSSEFAEPIARKEEEALARLRARVRPFILRRTKAQVLAELPPRIDQVERVPMTPFQERLYRAYLERARAEVEGADPGKSRFHILAALTRLRQVCCHPRLVLEEGAAPETGTEAGAEAGAGEAAELTGGKFELCLELLTECREEGHRVLLYSQFTSLLDLLEERLEALGIPRSRLDGSTRDREGVVRRFQSDSSIPVFLVSLKAGGFGLNLTQADTVILYDPWWNPAVEEQAAARAHRMGQTLPVHVHRLITLGTVEEKVLELKERKRDLAARLLGGEEEPLAALDLDELRGVLFGGPQA